MLPDLLVQIYSRHAVYLEGYKTQAQREFERFLKDMESDILRQLGQVDDLQSLKGRRLNAVLKAVRKTLETGFGDYETAWRKQLDELAEYESGFTTRALGQVVNTDFTLPAPAQIVTAAFAQPLQVKGTDGGALLEAFYRNWTGKTEQRITGAIRLAVAQGETLPQLVRRIRGTRAAKYRDGLLDATRRDVALMARTAYHHVATQARAAVYEANADIVKAEEYVAVLDGRTSVQCRSLSGREFPVNKGPVPPLHLACRSMRVPVLKDGLDLLAAGGTQFSRGADGIKRVDADLTYFQWLKTQPKGFQDSVIGPERGKLLRNGGLTAERFSALQLDKNFRPRTLDEIRALEPEAFARAFGGTGGSGGGSANSSQPRAFKYQSFTAPKSVADAELFIEENGIAGKASLKGVAAVKQSPESLQAMQEVTERFGLAPLAGIGPSTRFVRKKLSGANAAIFPTVRGPDGNLGLFHTPIKFGNIKDRTRQHGTAIRTSPKYQSERDDALKAGKFAFVGRNLTDIDPEAARAARRVGDDFGWSVSSMSDPALASKMTTYHEYGHVLHLVDKRIGSKIESFVSTERPYRAGWTLSLSKYAESNPKEYVAESFAVYMGKPKEHWRIHPRLLSIFREFDLANDQ